MMLITGAAGLVRNALTRKLASQGNKVKGIVTPTDYTTSLKHLDIEIIIGDVRDFELLCKTFKNTRIVHHLAGINSITTLLILKLARINLIYSS